MKATLIRLALHALRWFAGASFAKHVAPFVKLPLPAKVPCTHSYGLAGGYSKCPQGCHKRLK